MIASPIDDDAPTRTAIDAARAVMAAHLAALNARDEEALAATLHFPHYRLSGNDMRIWDGPKTYFEDFRARAEPDWQKSRWDRLDVLQASPDKVHLDVAFTRLGPPDSQGAIRDGSPLASYRSLWVITRIDGRWAAQLRSSFAP